jgi:lipid-A-disaccharide synthase
MTRSFLIIAGETSGDKHAARLVESLKKREDVRVIGIGGDRMKAAGVELIHHVKEMSVMGFSEVVSKLPFFRRVRRDLLRTIHDEEPSAVILVDYPGFNLRFAESAKKKGLKVIYFISPQVWAWGKTRMKKIRRTVDLMLTIFKFEEEMYKKENVDAHFVGHPLLDEMKTPSEMEIDRFREKFVARSANGKGQSTLDMEALTGKKQNKIIALLPGSRLQEINRILPTMLESVKIVKGELADDGTKLQPIVGCAPGIEERVYHEIVSDIGIEVHLTREVELLMSSANAGMVASGTATLEAALHNLPIVVVYKTSFLTYSIGKLLVNLSSISLVNIVAQRKIVHELVQNDFEPRKAASIVKEILMNSQVSDEIRHQYAELRKSLGGPGASDRAAELILGAV